MTISHEMILPSLSPLLFYTFFIPKTFLKVSDATQLCLTFPVLSTKPSNILNVF